MCTSVRGTRLVKRNLLVNVKWTSWILDERVKFCEACKPREKSILLTVIFNDAFFVGGSRSRALYSELRMSRIDSAISHGVNTRGVLAIAPRARWYSCARARAQVSHEKS